MFSVLFILVLLSASSQTAARLWPVTDVGQLLAAFDTAVAGDVVQLAAGTYELTRTLTIRRGATLRSAVGARAVLHGTRDVEVLIAVAANGVTLRDLIFGRAGSERAIDVLVGAGQYGTADTAAASYNTAASLLAQQNRRRRRSLDAVRTPRVGVVTSGGANRALRNFALINVDFSASASAVNVAFDSGAYIGVVVRDSVFGSYARSKALVTVADARFTDSAPVAGNAFGRASTALLGTGLALGANFWLDGAPSASIYCIDRHCTVLGPVTDGDAPSSHAYASIAAAVADGTTFVLVTAAEVEMGGPVIITEPGTRIEGSRADDCVGGIATIHLRTANDTIRSAHGALASLANLRLLLSGSARNAISYGEEEEVSVDVRKDALAEITNVVVLGSADATAAIILMSQFTQVTVRNALLSGVSRAIVLQRGSLIVADSTFVANEQASIEVSGSGTNTGLRVSGSLFVGAPHGSIRFDKHTRSASLLEFYISCSRFVFAALQEPSDCAGALCANALSHNTFIEDSGVPLHDGANRRFLARGGNHVERVPETHFGHLVRFVRSDGSVRQHEFALADHQGRLAAVRATASVTDGVPWSFALASYVPMRQECFAGSLPVLEAGSAPRVVSNLFQLSSDAAPRCVSLALRFAIADPNADLHDGSDLAVYDVRDVGNAARGGAAWQRAPTHSVFASGGGVVVEASGGAGALLRAVVVAAHATSDERAASLDSGTTSGVIAVPRAQHQLCVACGTEFPAHVVDERCGGGAGNSVYTEFDTAFAAAMTAIGDSDSVSVSLLVHGVCATAACTLTLPDAKAFTLEGLSTTQRGTIQRPAKCASATPFVHSVGDAGAVTLRFLLLAPEQSIPSAVPRCAVQIDGARGPRLAFSTLSGGVCIGSASLSASKPSVVIGNEIAPVSGEPAAIIDGSVLLEANTLHGNVIVGGSARLDRNTFGAAAAVHAVAGSTALSSNRFVDRVIGDTACASSANGAEFSSVGDLFGAHCALNLVGGATGKVRVSGAHSEWRDVRIAVRGGSRDVRISNAALLGANAAIGVLDGALSSVVLHNVALNTQATPLSTTLIGAASTRSECAAAHEAALGGFDLAHSVIVDVVTKRVLLTGATKQLSEFSYIDPSSGDVRDCTGGAQTPYCACVEPPPPPLEEQPVRKQQEVEPEVIIAAAPTRRAARIVVAKVDNTQETSVFVQLLPLWIALAIIVVCFIGIVIFCLCAGSATVGTGVSTVITGATYHTGGGVSAQQYAGSPPALSSLSVSLAPSDGVRHRRTGQQ